jgi:non-heme Fe2+,alpha-ketoglutarate-dependent halogenase
MPKKLTRSQIEQYRRDGCCFPLEAFTSDEARRDRHRLEDIERRHPEQLTGANRNNAHYACTCLDEIVHHPAILDAVEDLLGPDLLVWGSVIFLKEPASDAFVSWHQDATYQGLEPNEGLTAWVAITSSTVKSGCMRIIPGSHRGGLRTHHDRFGEDNVLTRGQTIDQIDAAKAVDVELAPGEFSLHDTRVVHSSQPNRSGERRIGFAIQTFITPRMRQQLGPDIALLVRGKDRYGHFSPGRRPRRDMAPEAVNFRDHANATQGNLYYAGADRRRDI